jgi:serine/threonine protein phosphatase PrpC
MPSQLKISIGQHSDKGHKETNQDFHGVYVPLEPQLSSKGIAIAVADGISSSDVSHIASESTVKGFLGTISAPRKLVGKEICTTGTDSNKFLAAFTDAAQPVSLRFRQRVRVYLECAGHQVYDRSHFPCR